MTFSKCFVVFLEKMPKRATRQSLKAEENPEKKIKLVPADENIGKRSTDYFNDHEQQALKNLHEDHSERSYDSLDIMVKSKYIHTKLNLSNNHESFFQWDAIHAAYNDIAKKESWSSRTHDRLRRRFHEINGEELNFYIKNIKTVF